MRKVSVFARFPSIGIALVAGALATTTALPDAAAQGKAPAAAAKKPDKKTRDGARKAYGQAEKDYEAGEYAKAADGFKKANELIPAPQAQYWYAMSLLKQDKKEEAAAAFESLLADPNIGKLGDDKVAEAKSELEKIKGKEQGELNLNTTPAGATVTVDGAPQMGETPMIIKLPPGSHQVSISSPGYETKEMSVEITAGKTLDQNVELALSESTEPVGAPAPVPEEPPAAPPPAAEPRSKVPAYVTLGIAGASAAVGTFFGIRALSAKSDFDDDPTTDKADDVERNALIADMAFGVAITLGVTGVVLLTSSDSEPAAEAKVKPVNKPRLDFAPYVSKQGGGAAARLTF